MSKWNGRRRLTDWFLPMCIGAVLALDVSGAAAADPPLAGDRAVEFANKGLEDYGAGKWEEAYESFRMANGIVPSPPFRLYMARARRQQQRLIESREIYREVASASLASDAPPSFHQAQTDARAEVGEVEASIGSVVVTIEGAKGPIALTLDGKAIVAGATIEVDPGTREIIATADGTAETRRVDVRAGQRGLAITLRFAGASGKGGAPKTEAGGGLHLAPWGWVIGSVGAASSIAGAVLGGLALQQDGSITERCTPSCPSSERATLESDQSTMLSLADASTGTLIAGGVLVAAGVTLLVIDLVAKPGAGPRVQADLGPRFTGLRIEF